MVLCIASPYLSRIRPKFSAKGRRRVHSARAGGGRVFVQRDATSLPQFGQRRRPRSADGASDAFDVENLKSLEFYM